jgi:hypothetical protein
MTIEDSDDEITQGLLNGEIHNPKPDTSIYTDPETFGTEAGNELDKALNDDGDMNK